MKKSILFFLILSMILHVGCTIGDNTQVRDEIDDTGFTQVAASDNEILNISEDIADSVVELYGIDDAAAIVLNDNALVGIVLAHGQEMTLDMVDTITSTIEEYNPQIKKVHISLNTKIFNQIEDIVLDLLQGESYDNYVDQISKMIDKVEKEK